MTVGKRVSASDAIHRWEAHWARRQAGEPPTGRVPRDPDEVFICGCVSCGRLFLTVMGALRSCDSCSRFIKGPTRVSRTCLVCGVDFRPLLSEVRFGRAKVCSRNCARSLISAMKRQRVPKTCVRCGKSFTVKPSRSSARFCSIACARPGQKNRRGLPKIEKVCEFCGKSFVVRGSQASQRFCSYACFWRLPQSTREFDPSTFQSEVSDAFQRAQH